MFYLKWNRGFPFPKWRENETSAFLEGFTKKFPVFRKQKVQNHAHGAGPGTGNVHAQDFFFIFLLHLLLPLQNYYLLPCLMDS